jgi:hypothetical protein
MKTTCFACLYMLAILPRDRHRQAPTCPAKTPPETRLSIQAPGPALLSNPPTPRTGPPPKVPSADPQNGPVVLLKALKRIAQKHTILLHSARSVSIYQYFPQKESTCISTNLQICRTNHRASRLISTKKFNESPFTPPKRSSTVSQPRKLHSNTESCELRAKRCLRPVCRKYPQNAHNGNNWRPMQAASAPSEPATGQQ